MYINVGGKEYKLEYNFEAAHDKKCVDLCWNYFSGAYMMKGMALNEADSKESIGKVATIDKMIDSMSDVPGMVLYLIYAGLLENHAGEIQSEADARCLYKQFCKEHPEDKRAMDMEMLDAIKKQMEEDGFFKRIGLQDFLDKMAEGEQQTKKQAKAPQDHKPKSSPSVN